MIFIEKHPKFFSYLFFESITYQILTSEDDSFNFGLKESSPDFIRMIFRFFNYLKNEEITLNIKTFLHSFFKLCIQNNLTDIYIFVQKAIGEEEKHLTFCELTPEKIENQNERFIDKLMLKLLDLYPELIFVFDENFDEFFYMIEKNLWNSCLVFSFFFKFTIMNEKIIEQLSKDSSFVALFSRFYQKFKEIQKINSMKNQKNEIFKKIN